MNSVTVTSHPEGSGYRLNIDVYVIQMEILILYMYRFKLKCEKSGKNNILAQIFPIFTTVYLDLD